MKATTSSLLKTGMMMESECAMEDRVRRILGVAGSCAPLSTVFLSGNDEQWTADSGYPHIVRQTHPWREASVDIRTYGLVPHETQNKTPAQVLAWFTDPPFAKWTVEPLANGWQRVSAYSSIPVENRPTNVFEWIIDPSQEFSIVSACDVEIGTGGARSIVTDFRADYEQVDGRWWPRRIEETCPRTGFHVLVDFMRAEFDRPDHPHHFGADLLAIPVGMSVISIADNRSMKSRYIGKGDVLNEDEWEATADEAQKRSIRDHLRQRLSQGSGSYPPWWNDTAGYYGLPDAPYQPDAWEVYVRRWLVHHSPPISDSVLQPAQRESAWSILKDCRTKAQPVQMRLGKELAALEASTQPLDRANSDVSGASGESVEFKKHKAALEHSDEIERIFRDLCNRLEALLDSAQRSNAQRPAGATVLQRPAPQP